jgi:hypothetical protein
MTYCYSKEKIVCSIIFLFLFCISINAQINTYNFDTNDIIIIKSPSKNYKDILLQSHKGLPRFGALNGYIISRGKIEPNTREKSQLIGTSYLSFSRMIQMNYMESIYNDFNREVFTYATSNDMSKKEKNSFIAQQHFSELSRTTGTKEAGIINAGTNEFERRRNFKEYVSNNLDGLRKWSSTLLKNNTVTGYWVNTVILTDYDFDKKGYWLRIPLAMTHPGKFSHYSFFRNFSPKTNYENKLLIDKGRTNALPIIKALFKISPEDAEKLQPKRQKSIPGKHDKKIANKIFFATKVKVTLKEFSASKNIARPEIPYLEHHFLSPIITLYKDAALTEKVGEISLENLITEN